MRQLEYIFASNSRAISTNPAHSDSVINLAHMEHLVGTLIKQGPSGRYEPYLAKAWKAEGGERIWSFTFRDDLECENGEKINALSFKEALERNLLIYSKNPLPIFKELKGFKEFLRDKAHLVGLVASDQTLRFEFNKPVKTGLLEFLSMPYYGYYCAANYDSAGKWKNDRSIISSGSFSLASVSDDQSAVTLQKRTKWFSVSDESPEAVTIRQMPLTEALKYPAENKIVFGYHDPEIVVPSDLVEVKSIPEILIAVVISPYIDNIFSSVDGRTLFYKKFRNAQNLIPFPDKENELSSFFYPYAKTELSEPKAADGFLRSPKKKLKAIVTDHLHEIHFKYLDEIFKNIFSGTQFTVDLQKIDRNDPNWMSEYRSNKKYDIRVAGVSIGGSFQNWVIEMMFCSNLGVSFPDPSHRICSLVKEFDETQMSIEEYGRRFNQILYEDKVVIPLFHRRYSWFVSKSVDYRLSPISGAPRFDLMRLKL